MPVSAVFVAASDTTSAQGTLFPAADAQGIYWGPLASRLKTVQLHCTPSHHAPPSGPHAIPGFSQGVALLMNRPCPARSPPFPMLQLAMHVHVRRW